MYQKNYSGGQPDYVTVVDLRSATILNLTGAVSGSPTPSSSVSRKYLGPASGSFWTDALAQNRSTRQARVLVNGTFFAVNISNTSITPVPIAFGLKVGYQIISYGYRPNGGLDSYAGFVKLFAFDSGRAAASLQPYNYPYSDHSVFTGGSPDVVGVLSTSAPKSPTSNIPRTFIGIRDDDGNGIFETVMFYSSKLATQSSADSVLSGFGASSRAMLDGGASTGLVVDGVAKITPGRTLPHAIAIYSGK